MRKRFSVAAMVVIAMMLVVPSVMAATLQPSFTQDELDNNWVRDRTYPTGGVDSVSAFSRSDVAQISIDSGQTAAGGFYRTEGIKTVGVQDFGTEVQFDLYIDPDWQDNAVRAGLWVVGDDGAGNRDQLFGIIEFVNSEACDFADCSTDPTNRPDHEGFRIWDSTVGWTVELDTEFAYGEWVTLGISLDTSARMYTYYINGESVGTATGGSHFISELFLNSYNFGLDEFPNLDNESYAAHWHVGVSMDDCKKGGWATFENPSFKNQGDCVSYVRSNSNSN